MLQNAGIVPEARCSSTQPAETSLYSNSYSASQWLGEPGSRRSANSDVTTDERGYAAQRRLLVSELRERDRVARIARRTITAMLAAPRTRGHPQAADVSVNYTVVYGFGGFISPLPRSTLSKSASNIPVKFRLTNASGVPISATLAAALAAAGKVQVTLAGPPAISVTVPCIWDPLNLFFQCNIKTQKGLGTGFSKPYTITAYENVGTGFVVAPPVGAAVNPETVYFK